MTIATEGLTRGQLAWLRKAKTISFHLYQGRAYIVATDEDEAKLEIDCAGTLTHYVGHAERRTSVGNGFSMLHAAQHHEVWRTIAGLLKVEDRLTLHFHGDAYTNGYAKAAAGTLDGAGSFSGLHVDALELGVERGAHRHQRLRFVVDASICPDNSARMVRP